MDSNAKIQRYAPGQVPEGLDLPEAMVQVYHELSEIAGVIGNLVEGRNVLSYAEPTKKRTGQVAYADGVKWNPGAGAGYYVYDGTNWIDLSHPYTPTTAFTPTVSFGGAAVGAVYGIQTGSYSIIGKRAFVCGRCQLTNKGASVGAAVINVPVSNTGILAPVNIGWEQGMINVPTGGYWTGLVLQLQKIAGGASALLTDADFTNNSDIIFSAMADLA